MSEETVAWRMPCGKILITGRHRNPCETCLALPHLKPVPLTAADVKKNRPATAQTINNYYNCTFNTININVLALTKETADYVEKYFECYFDVRLLDSDIKSNPVDRNSDPVSTFIRDLINSIKASSVDADESGRNYLSTDQS